MGTFPTVIQYISLYHLMNDIHGPRIVIREMGTFMQINIVVILEWDEYAIQIWRNLQYSFGCDGVASMRGVDSRNPTLRDEYMEIYIREQVDQGYHDVTNRNDDIIQSIAKAMAEIRIFDANFR